MTNFEIKPNIKGHIIVLLAVLLLMGITAWAFLWKEEPLDISGPGIIIIALIWGIGSVVIFMALKIIIKRPAVISIDNYGFEYNPGGVSTGIIPWHNVAEIKEIIVKTQQGDLNGPVPELVLAVKLKDPGSYRDQYNILLKGLINLNDKMYDADIFFRLSSFGNQVEEVKQRMFQGWKESGTSKSS